MAASTTFVGRSILAGGFAVVAAVAPTFASVAHQSSSTPLAVCPPGQIFDPINDACAPGNDFEGPINNPINPENEQLQTEAITGSQPGEVGRLPEVNGIPCNGDNTGLCIGLTEINESLGSQNSYGNPYN